MAQVKIGDRIVDVDPVALPDRALRDAWTLGAGDVVEIDPERLRTVLKQKAAERRWHAETGGTVIDLGGGPMTLPTDDRAKLLLLGAATVMADDATAPYVSGATSVKLNGAQFKTLYGAIVTHVQACFDSQMKLIEAIDSGNVTTIADIDAWTWPE